MPRTKEPQTYDGLPFYIGTGKKIEEDKLSLVQNALFRRTRNIQEWRTRYDKGQQVRNSIVSDEAGAVENVNMQFAYNAYFKFMHQSLESLRDSFRLSSNDYRVDVERPTTILKSYLEALQTQNDLLVDDAILYGAAAVLLDVNLDSKDGQPGIQVNRVKAAKIVYDFEQPGSGLFTIRITPEIAYKFDFLSDYNREDLFNRASDNAESVAEIRVFVGELVVDGELDNYIAIVFRRRVIYAERGRDLTVLRAVSINDKNDDFSPIYSILKSSEISRDVYKLIFDYNEEMANPIRTGQWNFDADAWEKAKITRYLKISPVGATQLTPLLPGELDVNGLVNIQGSIQQLSQQAAGLNEYTKGESGGSVRTAQEAMMLSDSASGILNIFCNKIKQNLILETLSDVLEILKLALANKTDIFNESLQIDVDIAKDQQESNLLLSLINMPMFGSVIQGLEGPQALQLFRWILEKLHISGTASIFDTLINNQINAQTNNAQQ